MEKIIRDEDLMTQTEARKAAREYNAKRSPKVDPIAVAITWPLGSWSGHERGWTVGYVDSPGGPVALA